MATGIEPIIVGSAVKMRPIGGDTKLTRDFGVGFVYKLERIVGIPSALVLFPKVGMRIAAPLAILIHSL